ncbi:GNAT family N-acetyltransferase [Paucibacter sp. APW11]|uniref:GNAT family N-acetyltransferase n=1 Tax=Roseateles aquae TaxID=3077235 RepID=A0ABU3PIG0_9BURK|nr:GNAT family N-acetyltransferase [Paucibacter sp. APW11]MDT9001801.1 GNAT family N-acetyltransferase [Paucibacter sp. APW11]
MSIIDQFRHSLPRFRSERLQLRPFEAQDFDGLAAFFAHPVSATYGGPCGRDEAWRKFAAYLGHWALRGYGPWALERLSDGAFIGLAGLWFPEGWLEPEITWALHPDAHGQGYATEAARRALQAAYEHFGWTTAISVVAAGNSASAAVAQRLGATLERTIPFRGGEGLVFRHLAPGLLAADC